MTIPVSEGGAATVQMVDMKALDMDGGKVIKVSTKGRQIIVNSTGKMQ